MIIVLKNENVFGRLFPLTYAWIRREPPRAKRARPCPEAPLLAPQAKKAQEARGQGGEADRPRIHAVMRSGATLLVVFPSIGVVILYY